MLRLLEHYASPQGEGPRTGVMSQFVRFAGCNLKCPGWPCDTPQAIMPKFFEREQTIRTPDTIISLIEAMKEETGARNVVFTGGEPLIQKQDEIFQIAEYLDCDGMTAEIFTNGTRPIKEDLAEVCSFVMDWKLPGSGEDPADETRIENLEILEGGVFRNAVKFVVTTQADLAMAHQLWKKHLTNLTLDVFVGAAWDKFSNETIVNYVKDNQLPWRLNVQVHNYVFGSQRRYT